MNENNFEILWPSELETPHPESIISTTEPVEVNENMQPAAENNDPSTAAVVATILVIGVIGGIINEIS